MAITADDCVEILPRSSDEFGSGAPTFEDRFQAFLSKLNEHQQARANCQKEELLQLYGNWSAHFEILKTHFEEVWQLFGSIQSQVSGWHRGSPCSGQWDFMGHSREGYNFGASIERSERAHSPFPSKWLSVTFGCGSMGRGGIGDERTLGRQVKIDQSLVGLDGCFHVGLQEQLKIMRRLEERVREMKLIFTLHNDKLAQKTAKIDLNLLNNYSLSEICRRLFVALNNDQFESFSSLLPDGFSHQLEEPRRSLRLGWSRP